MLIKTKLFLSHASSVGRSVKPKMRLNFCPDGLNKTYLIHA